MSWSLVRSLFVFNAMMPGFVYALLIAGPGLLLLRIGEPDPSAAGVLLGGAAGALFFLVRMFRRASMSGRFGVPLAAAGMIPGAALWLFAGI